MTYLCTHIKGLNLKWGEEQCEENDANWKLKQAKQQTVINQS